MDVGLGPFEDAPGSPGQQPVLILVLVDVGLGRLPLGVRGMGRGLVLILVRVDVGLGRSEDAGADGSAKS